jgi:hypothetical protein
MDKKSGQLLVTLNKHEHEAAVLTWLELDTKALLDVLQILNQVIRESKSLPFFRQGERTKKHVSVVKLD